MKNNKFDVIVIGAGHAGLEAAFACANIGLKVALFTINKKFIANMPCNPSIGGPAKGIVTREIDALGGMQAKAADHTQLQMKMLNSSKGPGVWALRAQVDKVAYHKWFVNEINKNKNISLFEKEIVDIIVKDNAVIGVKDIDGNIFNSLTTIITTGTFLKSIVHIGNQNKKEGPDGQKNSTNLSHSLSKLGFKLLRLKTGTPARILEKSIDYSDFQIERGTKEKLSFSHYDQFFLDYDKQLPCFLTYTNQEIHNVIIKNIKKSAMYSGQISGTGPRYCPSIEDKVIRFSDKIRHQIFIEPESKDLNTVYLQGFSTSFDYKTQDKIIRMLPGFKNCVIKKYAYAIEYDAIDPIQLKKTYESKKINRLFFAGQINGTSGYEEAAGQGIMAGINAAMLVKEKEQIILDRKESYIGVMTDDIMTKGVIDPYRLLTSRAEHRLFLRNDNAQERLIEYGKKVGLISKLQYQNYLSTQTEVNEILNLLSKARISNYKDLTNKYKIYNISLYQLAKRPDVNLIDLLESINIKNHFSDVSINKANIFIKFEGYIKNQEKAIEKLNKISNVDISFINDYKKVPHLSLEAIEKLNTIKPSSLDQAKRISGINLIDLSIIKYYKDNRKK